MNKLIKFINLLTILISNLSLYGMRQEMDLSQCTIGNKAYPITITTLIPLGGNLFAQGPQVYIRPNQFLVFSHINPSARFDAYKHIEIIEGNIIGYEYEKALALGNKQKITINFLQKYNLINVVFANVATCIQNNSKVKNLVTRYVPVFNECRERYINCARNILAQIQAREKATNFECILKLSKEIVARFFQEYSYEPAFIFSLSNLTPSFPNFVVPFMRPVLEQACKPFFDEINLLVEVAIRKHLHCYCTGDKLYGMEREFNLALTAPKDFTELAFAELTDNNIIAFTMCEARELLTAIDTIYKH
jgi:hypothetical protein